MERYKYKIILKMTTFCENFLISHLYSKQLCTLLDVKTIKLLSTV